MKNTNKNESYKPCYYYVYRNNTHYARGSKSTNEEARSPKKSNRIAFCSPPQVLTPLIGDSKTSEARALPLTAGHIC